MAGVPDFLWSYHRENYLYDEKVEQDRELLSYDFNVQLYNLFREDIRNFWVYTKIKMENIQVVCTIMLGITLALYTDHRPTVEQKVNEYSLRLFCFSSAVALAFSLLAVWFSVQCQLAAQCDNVHLLLMHTRLPIPSDSQLSTAVAKADLFESGEKNKVYRRVPFVDPTENKSSQPPLLARSIAMFSKDPESGCANSSRGSMSYDHLPQFISSGTESTLDHIKAFKALQAYWVNYDVYASICMSIGQFSFMHSIIVYIIFSVTQDGAQAAGIACTLVLSAMATVVIYLDLMKRDTLTHITCVLFCMPPVFALLVSIFDFLNAGVEYLRMLSICAFFSMALWYIWIWFLCMPTASGLPERYRSAVAFLDLFNNAGLCKKNRQPISKGDFHDVAVARAEAALMSPILPRRILPNPDTNRDTNHLTVPSPQSARSRSPVSAPGSSETRKMLVPSETPTVATGGLEASASCTVNIPVVPLTRESSRTKVDISPGSHQHALPDDISDSGDSVERTFRYWILRIRYGMPTDISDTLVRNEAIRINGSFLHWKLLRCILGLAILLCLLLTFSTILDIGAVPRRRLQSREHHSRIFPWPYVPTELFCQNGSLGHSNGYVTYGPYGQDPTDISKMHRPDQVSRLSATTGFALRNGDVIYYENRLGVWFPLGKLALRHPAIYVDIAPSPIGPDALVVVTGHVVLRVPWTSIQHARPNPNPWTSNGSVLQRRALHTSPNPGSVLERNAGKAWIQVCRFHGHFYLLGGDATQWEITEWWLDG